MIGLKNLQTSLRNAYEVHDRPEFERLLTLIPQVRQEPPSNSGSLLDEMAHRNAEKPKGLK